MEITKEILKTIVKKEITIEFIENRKKHNLRYTIIFSKIKNKLGCELNTSFKKNIIKAIQRYQDNKS